MILPDDRADDFCAFRSVAHDICAVLVGDVAFAVIRAGHRAAGKEKQEEKAEDCDEFVHVVTYCVVA